MQSPKCNRQNAIVKMQSPNAIAKTQQQSSIRNRQNAIAKTQKQMHLFEPLQGQGLSAAILVEPVCSSEEEESDSADACRVYACEYETKRGHPSQATVRTDKALIALATHHHGARLFAKRLMFTSQRVF